MNNAEKESIIAQVRQAIASNVNNELLVSHNRFFKDDEIVKCYGLKTAEVRKIAKTIFKQIKDYPKQNIFELCEELWKSGYTEEVVVACNWSELQHKKYEPTDFAVFEQWIKKYVTNWAYCDALCNHTVGMFLMMYPSYITELKRWATSPNRWVRRASAVSLIIPARKGLFLNNILEISNVLLLDNDDLVQKGYGWMLKAASMSEPFVKASKEIKKEHLDAVYNFVIKNKQVMPRTALRYAIEKMPADMKLEAMKK